MIISPGRQIIFAHMPKTGGTSLAHALESRAHRDDILIGDTPKAKQRKRRLKNLSAAGRLWKHSTLADIEGIVTADQMRDWFVFSLVRNPWDRAVSYYHWLQDQSFDHPVVTLAKAVPFGRFVTEDAVLRALQANPVARFTTDAVGVDHANLVARLEFLADDLQPLWDHLGFEVAIPHLNRSNRAPDYVDAYDDAGRRAVERACREDIERFGYRFGC